MATPGLSLVNSLDGVVACSNPQLTPSPHPTPPSRGCRDPARLYSVAIACFSAHPPRVHTRQFSEGGYCWGSVLCALILALLPQLAPPPHLILGLTHVRRGRCYCDSHSPGFSHSLTLAALGQLLPKLAVFSALVGASTVFCSLIGHSHRHISPQT